MERNNGIMELEALKFLSSAIEKLLPSNNEGSYIALIVIGFAMALYVSLPALKFASNFYDFRNRCPGSSHSSGFSILVAIIVGYLSSAKTYGTSMFNNYTGAFAVAFFVALLFSIIVYIFSGYEKYLHAIPLDVPPLTKEPELDQHSTGLKAYLFGRRRIFVIVDIDSRAMVVAVGLIFLELLVLSGLRSHILYHRNGISNAMMVYVGCVSWYVIDQMVFEFLHSYSCRRYFDKFGALEIFYAIFLFPLAVFLGMIPLVKNPQRYDISHATAMILACIFLAGWLINRVASIERVLVVYERGACDIFKHKLLEPSRLAISGLWGLCRDIDILGLFLQLLVFSIPAILVAKQLQYRIQAVILGPLLHAMFYLLFYRNHIERKKSEIYGASWSEYVRAVPKSIIPFIY